MTNKRKKHVRAHAAKAGMSYQAALQSGPPKFTEVLAKHTAKEGVSFNAMLPEADPDEQTFTDIFDMFGAMRAYAKGLGEGVEAIPCDSPPYLGYSVFKPATEAGPEEARLFQIRVQDLSASLKRAEESGKPVDYFYTSHTPTPPERPSNEWPKPGPVPNPVKAQIFREYLKTAEGRRKLGQTAVSAVAKSHVDEPKRCERRCDHGSQCVLPAGHTPPDCHDTEHGCTCWDPEPLA